LIASHVKDMSVEDFLKIFGIEEWKRNLRT